MPPVLVAPPAGPLVPTETCRDYCGVTGTHDQLVIAGLRDAAEAQLDGYAGILGRCLMRQTWRETFDCWGSLRLALPDVIEADVTGLDADGIEVAGEVEYDLKRDDRGWYVSASGPAAASVQVEYVCEAPEAVLKVATVVVMMLVKHWYDRRDMVADATMAEIPFAASSLIANIRRGRIA